MRVVLLSCLTVAVTSTPFTCEDAYGLNFSRSDSSNIDSECCNSKPTVAGMIFADDAICDTWSSMKFTEQSYACPLGTSIPSNYNEDDVTSGVGDSQLCCTDTYDVTCNSHLDNHIFQCKDGFEFDETQQDSTVTTADTCCKTFKPRCHRYTQLADSYAEMMFKCADGTKKNSTAFNDADSTPSQDECCQPIIPTCGEDKFEGTYFDCPAGKVSKLAEENREQFPNFQTMKEIKNANSSVANCCQDFVPRCSVFKEDGTPFKCEFPSVLRNEATEFIDSLGTFSYPDSDSPSQITCCGPATCNNAFQSTCGDTDGTGSHFPHCAIDGLIYDTSKADVAHGTQFRICCKADGIDGEFSGTSKMDVRVGMLVLLSLTVLTGMR